MVETGVLPRLVVRGNTARSREGPVPLGEAEEALNRGLEAFEKVLIWDLDGIERNRPNLELVRRFEGENLWVDAGVRFVDNVIDVLVAGADRAVVGTKTLRDMNEFEEATELTDSLVPLLDFARGRLWGPESLVMIHPSDLIRAWRERGVESLLVLDEGGEFPRPLLDAVPDGLSVFAGLVPAHDAHSLPGGRGAIVDFWEVVPRKT